MKRCKLIIRNMVYPYCYTHSAVFSELDHMDMVKEEKAYQEQLLLNKGTV